MVFTPKIFSLPDNDWPQLRRVLARLFRCFKGRDVTNTTIFSLPDNDWPMLKQILQRLFKLCRARIETRSIIFSLPDNDWPQLRQILTRLFDCCGTEIGCDSCDLDVVSYSLTFHDLVDCGAAPIAAILNGNTFTTDNSAMNDAGNGKKWWKVWGGLIIYAACNYCGNCQALVHVGRACGTTSHGDPYCSLCPFLGKQSAPMPAQMNNFNQVAGRCNDWDGSDCIFTNGKVECYEGYVDIVPNF